jgi:acetylornithine deacetylase/succinyl-diaminopimelate desuccinylase-like protein
MRRQINRSIIAMALGTSLTAPVMARPTIAATQHAETLALWKAFIAIPTVQGRGKTIDMANDIADRLRKGGFAPDDVIVEPMGDTATLVARYRGTGKGKPILLSGHMDVVEARASDWTRDPFTPIEENGYLYGRGALDMKFGDAVMVSTLLQLKREGFRPTRDIIMLLSGDEETEMATTIALAKKYGDAEIPRGRRAELRGRRHVPETRGRFQPWAKRTRADRQHRSGAPAVAQPVDRPVEMTARPCMPLPARPWSALAAME